MAARLTDYHSIWVIDRLEDLGLSFRFREQRQPKCYISGPMTGLPNFNFPSFEKAAEILRTAGWFVYSPRENDAEKGLEPDPEGKLHETVLYKDLMKLDLWQVCDSDAVFVLPGWEYSEGALLEVEVAHRVRVPVYSLLSCRPIPAEERAPHEFSSQVVGVLRVPKIGAPEDLANPLVMRQFETGATRNRDDDAIGYEGFLSPLTLYAFGQYMHRHRRQADGTLRAPDNWQRGIPLESYMQSLWRHMMDLWLHHRGYGHLAREDVLDALAGLYFNAGGYTHEVMKKQLEEAA